MLVIFYDELCAGWYPGLPEEGHVGLGGGAVAFPLVAGGMGSYGVQPLGAAAPGSGLDVVHGVGVVQAAVRAAEPVPAKDTVLAVLHPAGRVAPVCHDVPHQAEDSWDRKGADGSLSVRLFHHCDL